MHSVRSELYMLAAGLFNVPTAGRDRAIYGLAIDLLETDIIELPWRRPLRAIAHDLADPEAAQTAAAEYLRLFVLPLSCGTASPFASHWLQCQGVSTWEVEDLMEEQGLEMGGESDLMADHISAELEFMAHLAQNSPKGAQRMFLRSHLALWTPQFTNAIRAAKPLPRFAHAAEFLDRLITWDLEKLCTGWPWQAPDRGQRDWAWT
jgi:TorA maturation chaperone TorD